MLWYEYGFSFCIAFVNFFPDICIDEILSIAIHSFAMDSNLR